MIPTVYHPQYVLVHCEPHAVDTYRHYVLWTTMLPTVYADTTHSISSTVYILCRYPQYISMISTTYHPQYTCILWTTCMYTACHPQDTLAYCGEHLVDTCKIYCGVPCCPQYIAMISTAYNPRYILTSLPTVYIHSISSTRHVCILWRTSCGYVQDTLWSTMLSTVVYSDDIHSM